MLKAKLLGATAGAQAALPIEDVFSTYLYTGNSSTQTITNGIDLAGEGGLVWIKGRSGATDHQLFDTLRGATKELISNSTAAETTDTDTLTAFSANGFSLGADATTNTNAATYASWTFRKAPRFFDVVTYTGTGSPQTIAHNLGTTVGTLIIKTTGVPDVWRVYHRSTGNQYVLTLNATLEQTGPSANHWNNTDPTDSHFTVGVNGSLSGRTYVAYLFAHDPLGPSGDGSDGLIACGSFTGNGSLVGPSVELGWEPQWLLVKRAVGGSSDWLLVDSMRGVGAPNADNKVLRPNASGAELDGSATYGEEPYSINSTGFSVTTDSSILNASGNTYIYIAIRRGPMREPTVGTEVFDAYFNSSSVTLGQSTGVTIVPDFVIARDITAATRDFNVADRLRGAGGINPDASYSKNALYTNTTGAEVSDTPFFDIINRHGNVTVGGEGHLVAGLWGLFLKRAPGFFDIVAYTGTGANRTISHNLGVAPEMMIVKKRSAVDNWVVYAGDATDYLILNSTAATDDLNTMWNDTAPTSSVFSLGTNDDVNGSGATFIAYLFATLPGISKVGSYTGNGSSQTINCAFTTGARFILIKRTDSTGDWYVWDTKQGIVSGNDPRLKLNDPGSQVTTDDSVDPANSGFIVNQVAATNVNVSSASYIFYAVS